MRRRAFPCCAASPAAMRSSPSVQPARTLPNPCSASCRRRPAMRGFRASNPGLHRYRHQGRVGENLGMGVPQRSQREPDVQGAVPMDQRGAPGPQDHLWRCRGGFRPFPLHLAQGDEGALARGRLRGAGRIQVAPERRELHHPSAPDEEGEGRYRRHLGASLHDLRCAEGDEAPARQAAAAGRPDEFVKYGDPAGLLPNRRRASSSRPASRRSRRLPRLPPTRRRSSTGARICTVPPPGKS